MHILCPPTPLHYLHRPAHQAHGQHGRLVSRPVCAVAQVPVRSLLRLEQCIGDGYAQSTSAELEFLIEVARHTGVILDPVYSGKAALGMVHDLKARPGAKRVCFIHTGGMLGLYAQTPRLQQLVGPWQ